MPISLESLRQRFLQRLRVADSAFERHIVTPSLSRQFDRSALQEGLLSNLWQSWNLFCRDILIASAAGCNTASGALTSSPYVGRSDSEISFVSLKLSRNQHIGVIRPLVGRHLEPTWGDAVKLNRISIGIGASNSATLTSAFSGVRLISDLQICRNACAHLNSDTLSAVAATRVRYSETRLRHPSQMMFWSDPLTNDFAWKAWIDEMILIADLAVV